MVQLRYEAIGPLVDGLIGAAPMTPVIFGKYEIGLFTDDGRYLSHGRKIMTETAFLQFMRDWGIM